MSTTTIRLPEDLKATVTQLARLQGKTTHAYILEALAAKADMDSKAAGFEAEAEARLHRIKAGGKTLKWDDVKKSVRTKLRNINDKD